MPDKAGSAGNNGELFPRSPTQYGAILAAKIVLFLLGIRFIMEEPDPEKAMENYRQGLRLICSQEEYDAFEKSGFAVIYRDESRTIEQTVALAEEAFGLKQW